MNRTTPILITLHCLFWIYNICRILIFGKSMYQEYTITWLLFDQVLIATVFYVHYFYILPFFFKKQKPVYYLLWLVFFTITSSLIYGAWDYITLKYFSLNQYDNSWGSRIDTSLLFAAFLTSFRFAADWLYNVNRNQQLLIQKTTTQIQLMKSNVNIPFMLQTLTSMERVAKVSPRELEHPVIHLSNVLRYGLYETQQPQVTINREAEILNEYIQLVNLNSTNFKLELINKIENNEDLFVPPNLIIKLISSWADYSCNSIIGVQSIILEIKENVILLNLSTPSPKDEFLKNAHLLCASVLNTFHFSIEEKSDRTILLIKKYV